MGDSQLLDSGGAMFDIVPFVIAIGFIIVFGAILFAVIKGVKQWSDNNASPVLTRAAPVVAKRGQVSTSHRAPVGNTPGSLSTTTTYFVTFQFPGNSERLELPVTGKQHGETIEGDEDQLTYQGTRFKGFDRSQRALPYPTEPSEF